jgi:hypothetical protein
MRAGGGTRQSAVSQQAPASAAAPARPPMHALAFQRATYEAVRRHGRGLVGAWDLSLLKLALSHGCQLNIDLVALGAKPDGVGSANTTVPKANANQGDGVACVREGMACRGCTSKPRGITAAATEYPWRAAAAKRVVCCWRGPLSFQCSTQWQWGDGYPCALRSGQPPLTGQTCRFWGQGTCG